MLTIRKATTADCELIHKLAWQIFPETYKDILSPEHALVPVFRCIQADT